jgi:hypothetical protein
MSNIGNFNQMKNPRRAKVECFLIISVSIMDLD